ncbi:hypothetical protein [Streptomyces himalayensis]|uniref:Uncharacterized protein n=1 Tax=Streptomyces himalayensis subsp. himalayensis TaxID=2756131 RepID=A0A7W0DRB2_9ACTN|nr:hypothetical protein [Streptomyces himalayensis]MBA2949814.1 hypothetical protein [Streptomyces himalayensis subsp. himalayensis]
MDTEPEVISHALESVEFESFAQMAVTSTAVVRATVTEVNPGRIVGGDETAEPGEESAATQARDVTLKVTQTFSIDDSVEIPELIIVEEWGWDADGDGFQVNNYTWSEVGEEYFFFLGDSDSSDPIRQNVISTEGRIHINENGSLSPSAEEGSAVADSIDNLDDSIMSEYMTQLNDISPEDLPTPADMPEEASPGDADTPIQIPSDDPSPDLGTGDGSEPTPYPSAT